MDPSHHRECNRFGIENSKESHHFSGEVPKRMPFLDAYSVELV